MKRRFDPEGQLSPGPGPKYVRIYSHLKDQIERGRLANGQYLRPEDQLARGFGVSVGTVKKALGMLKAENYIQSRKGDGTRVSFSSASARDTKAVVVLMGSINRSFYAEIYGGIQRELDQRHYKPILIDTQGSVERERDCLDKYGEAVGGFLIVPARDNRNHACYGRLLADGVPFVFMDRYLPELNVDAVVADNVRGGYLATRHLLELGHRRIAVPAPRGETSMQHRIEGYGKALSEFGVPFDESLLIRAKETGYPAGYELADKVAADHPDVAAAFCMRDDAAWGCLGRLSELGIRVPQDLSVIGYDDNEDICCRLRPRLTTVRQPKAEMGAASARLLVDRLEGRSRRKPSVVSLPVELILRDSTGVPRRGALRPGRGRRSGRGGGDREGVPCRDVRIKPSGTGEQ